MESELGLRGTVNVRFSGASLTCRSGTRFDIHCFQTEQSLNAHPGINVIFDGIVMDVNDSFHQMHRFQLMLL